MQIARNLRFLLGERGHERGQARLRSHSRPGDFFDRIALTTPDFYKGLLDHVSEGVCFVDRERKVQYWNDGAQRISGYKVAEVLGRHCHDGLLCHLDYDGRALCHGECPLSATIADGVFREARVFLRNKGGGRVPVLVRVQPIRGRDGSAIGAVETFSDDSAYHETRRKIDALGRMAFLDHLTQLPNRRCLETALDTVLSEYAVHHNPFGVLMFDLNGFKAINDTFGHNFGDVALQKVAFTLAGGLRPSDSIGRWGGDEFLAIVQDVDAKILNELTERCVQLVARISILSTGGSPVPLSVSGGAVLVYPGVTAKEIIQRADELMYWVKAKGRSRPAQGRDEPVHEGCELRATGQQFSLFPGS